VDGGLQLGLIGVVVEGGVGGGEVGGGMVAEGDGRKQPTLKARDRMRIREITKYFIFTRFISV